MQSRKEPRHSLVNLLLSVSFVIKQSRAVVDRRTGTIAICYILCWYFIYHGDSIFPAINHLTIAVDSGRMAGRKDRPQENYKYVKWPLTVNTYAWLGKWYTLIKLYKNIPICLTANKQTVSTQLTLLYSALCKNIIFIILHNRVRSSHSLLLNFGISNAYNDIFSLVLAIWWWNLRLLYLLIAVLLRFMRVTYVPCNRDRLMYWAQLQNPYCQWELFSVKP